MGNVESFRLYGNRWDAMNGGLGGGSDTRSGGGGKDALPMLVNYEFVRDIQRQIEFSARNPTAYLITVLSDNNTVSSAASSPTHHSMVTWNGSGGSGGSGGGGVAQPGPLIAGTLRLEMEEEVINRLMERGHFSQVCLVLYGQGCSDARVIRKYKQLVDFGFTNVKMYMGGIFEWLLLQECFGEEFFRTTGTRRPQDILTALSSSD